MDSRKQPRAADAPDGVTQSQQDPAQVLDVAERRLSSDNRPIGLSAHGRPNDPADVISDDVPDLIDRMEEMVQSGHIDEGAYEGEPIHDDAEGPFGDAGHSLEGDEPLP